MRQRRELKSLDRAERALLPLLDELDAILAEPGHVFPSRLREIAVTVRTTITRHLDAEEASLFPAVERRLPDEGGAIETLRQEHGRIRGLVDDFEDRVVRRDGAEARLLGRRLSEELRRHMEIEHRIFLPLAASLLEPSELEEIAKAMAGVEAPESPRPAGPRSRRAEDGTLDLRDRPVWERPGALAEAFRSVPEGGELRVLHDHEPSPLYFPFAEEFGGAFEWKAQRTGPREWRLEIRRRRSPSTWSSRSRSIARVEHTLRS